MLSGDVHHAYLAEVAFRRGARVRSAVCQAVCCDILPLVSGDDDPLGVEDLATHHLPLDEAPPIDIEDVLGEIRVPTLVLHRRGEQVISVESSRQLAERIPGARLVGLPGVDHHPWIGETEPVHRALEEFLRGL